MIEVLVILTMCTLSTPSTCEDVPAGSLRLSDRTECWVAAQPVAAAWIAQHSGFELGGVRCE